MDESRKRICELELELRNCRRDLEAERDRSEDFLRQARSFREAHDCAAEIISKMERNKPEITLPSTKLWAGAVPCFESREIIEILRAAGVKVKE